MPQKPVTEVGAVIPEPDPAAEAAAAPPPPPPAPPRVVGDVLLELLEAMVLAHGNHPRLLALTQEIRDLTSQGKGF